MGIDAGCRDHVMELLRPLGHVSGRAMFGGWGIYEGGAMWALISSNDTLYFKVDDTTRDTYLAAGSTQFLGNMPYFTVPADWLEDAPTLHAHARTAIAIGHATARAKPRPKPKR